MTATYDVPGRLPVDRSSAKPDRTRTPGTPGEIGAGPAMTPADLLALQRGAGNAAVSGLVRNNASGPGSGVHTIQRVMLTAENNRGGVPAEGVAGIQREDPDGASPRLDYYDDTPSYAAYNKVYLVGHGRPGRFDGNDADKVGDRLTRPGHGIDKDHFVLITVFSCQTGAELGPGLGANFASELNNTLHDRGYLKVETTAPKGDIIVAGDRWFVISESDPVADNAIDDLIRNYKAASTRPARLVAMKALQQAFEDGARQRGGYYAAASLAALKRSGAFARLLSANRIKGVLEEVRATPPTGLPSYFD